MTNEVYDLFQQIVGLLTKYEVWRLKSKSCCSWCGEEKSHLPDCEWIQMMMNYQEFLGASNEKL